VLDAPTRFLDQSVAAFLFLSESNIIKLQHASGKFMAARGTSLHEGEIPVCDPIGQDLLPAFYPHEDFTWILPYDLSGVDLATPVRSPDLATAKPSVHVGGRC